jgi:nucleoid-associated protein YgaU
LFLAARPAVRPQLAPDLFAGPRVAAPEGVVVHRGDTLWDIVGRALGPAASDLEIAREWPRWYAHNRSVIGDDPDLILPGQVLRRPDVIPSGTSDAPDPIATHGGH